MNMYLVDLFLKLFLDTMIQTNVYSKSNIQFQCIKYVYEKHKTRKLQYKGCQFNLEQYMRGNNQQREWI